MAVFVPLCGLTEQLRERLYGTRYGVGEYPGAFWPLGHHGDGRLQQYLIW